MNIKKTLRRLKKRLFFRREGEKKLFFAYKQLYGKDLNIDHPSLFSEKLFARMIHTNRHGNRLYTQLADKYLAREYVRNKIGEQHLIPLLWNGFDPDTIPFDRLPPNCVIKTNHGCGTNIIKRGEIDHEKVVRQMDKWLRENYYFDDCEYHYYEIKPRILVEELLDDGEPGGPFDYRFWCFDGRPAVIQVDDQTHSINPFYDLDWNHLSLHYRDEFLPCSIPKPSNLSEMLHIASELASDFDFVRVDLYNVHGKIYFGEMTFTPVAGRCILKPGSWDIELGDKWHQAIRI